MFTLVKVTTSLSTSCNCVFHLIVCFCIALVKLANAGGMSDDQLLPWVDSTLRTRHRDHFKLLTQWNFSSTCWNKCKCNSSVEEEYVSGSSGVRMNHPDPQGCWFNYPSLCLSKTVYSDGQWLCPMSYFYTHCWRPQSEIENCRSCSRWSAETRATTGWHTPGQLVWGSTLHKHLLFIYPPR